jgi:hypothetical protein
MDSSSVPQSITVETPVYITFLFNYYNKTKDITLYNNTYKNRGSV